MAQLKLNIVENYSLRHLNTFGIDVKAKYYCEIESIDQFKELLCNENFINNENRLLLGGGSNILFTKDFQGFVIRICIKGIRIYKEKVDHVFISVGAGEIWHDLVKFSIENDLSGLENLSLIPGTVGAAPIQNIGAYGVEIKNVLVAVETVHLRNGNRRLISKSLMKLGYRDSIFKNELKGKYIITSVQFRLSRTHNFHVSYGAIQDTLKANNVENLSLKAISDAVVSIRQSKLPDPAYIGNAGSFFKNPTVENAFLAELKLSFPTIPHYVVDENHSKLAAGWLIEQCGWKGKRVGNTGVHEKQALVLVNYGGATGNEIWQLALDIQQSVEAKFGIKLIPEVNVV